MTQLERFIELGEIELHSHPVIGLKRLLILDGGLLWFPVQKQIFLKFNIYYLNNNLEKINIDSLPKYEKILLADSNSRINPNTMQSVYTKDENSEEFKNSVTEYDYFKDLLKTSNSNFYSIVLNTILFRASEQGGSRFDN